MKPIKYLYSNTFKKEISFMPPRLQCHRGYWIGGIKENTLASIQKSFELGYQMAEFDVRMTRDKVVILYHDDFIDGVKISEIDFSVMVKKAHVQTLDQVLSWYKENRGKSLVQNKKNEAYKYYFYLNIEIKSKFVLNRELEQQIIFLLNQHQVLDSVLVSSFNPLSLAYFRKNCPDVPRALLLTYNNEHGNNFLVKSQVLNFFAYPHFLHLDEKYWRQKKYKKLLEFKVPVILWTCNDLKKVDLYFKQGVYGVISDQITPDEINKILEERK